MRSHTPLSNLPKRKRPGTRRSEYRWLALTLALALLLPAALLAWASSAAASCNYLSTLASIGSSPGQVLSPRGVATDSAGNVYIVDANDRVQKFNSAGAFVSTFATGGSGAGAFVSAIGVAVDSSNNVFVTDNFSERTSGIVQKFNSSGGFVTSWGTAPGSGNGQFINGAGGVAVDSAGNVYIADPGNNRIQKFSNSGSFITKWGTAGTGDGQVSAPLGVAVDASDNIYVADTGNDRIQVFTSTGTFIRKWGSTGSGDGQLNRPVALAVDAAGNVHVADTNNNRIEVFSNTGSFISVCGGPAVGTGNEEFSGPQGIAVDLAGNTYVADTSNDRVQKFGPAGATPPTADAGPDQTLECAGSTTSVALNGTASTPGSGSINSYSWSEGATPLGTGATLSTSLTSGSHTITLTVTDTGGGSDTDDVVVNIVDTTAPSISCPADVVVTLPPNSSATSMVVNYPAVTASDSCSSSVTVASVPTSGSVFPAGTTTVNATANDGNGNTASCSFHVTVLYNFTGFFPPVANPPTFNLVNAGRAIPVKFSLSGDKGLNIFAANSPSSGPVACNSSDDAANLVDTVTAGASSLSYDPSTDQYIYVWKTDPSWTGCRQLVVTLNDGSVHTAYFKFR